MTIEQHIMGIVQRLRDPMNSRSGLLAMEKEIHAHIDAKGIVLHTDPKYHVLNDARRVHGLSSERLCHQLHERHYLTSHDVIPLMVEWIRRFRSILILAVHGGLVLTRERWR
jgi:hypothetical protein